MVKMRNREIQIHNCLAKWLNFENPTAAVGAFTPDSEIRTGDVEYTENKNWYVFDREKDFISSW
jgi:hypothetical protein